MLSRWLEPIFAACCLSLAAAAATPAEGEVKQLQVTILSTMLADAGIGEWGFAALVEADGYRVLFDTGARPTTVLQNARELKVDLTGVRDVVLTHYHPDHTGGLLSLRGDVQSRNPAALSQIHAARGIFYSRPRKDGGEGNPMIAVRPQFESGGGKTIEHDRPQAIAAGVWVTGPVARVFPEKNFPPSGRMRGPLGLVEDTIPEDQSLVVKTTKGLVVITGCGHAGIVNILTAVRKQFGPLPIYAVIGGLHLYAAKDEQLEWTAAKLKEFGIAHLIGAHCTGIETLFRLRSLLGLSRQTAVVGAVGAGFSLSGGIRPGEIAR